MSYGVIARLTGSIRKRPLLLFARPRGAAVSSRPVKAVCRRARNAYMVRVQHLWLQFLGVRPHLKTILLFGGPQDLRTGDSVQLMPFSTLRRTLSLLLVFLFPESERRFRYRHPIGSGPEGPTCFPAHRFPRLVRVTTMCQSQSTPKVASGSEVDQSSGFHILEIHAPTASAGGMSAIIFLMLAGVIFLCVRRYCRCWRAPPRPPQPPPAALARCTSLQPQPESPIPVLSAQLQQQQMLLQNQLLQLRRDIYELADRQARPPSRPLQHSPPLPQVRPRLLALEPPPDRSHSLRRQDSRLAALFDDGGRLSHTQTQL